MRDFNSIKVRLELLIEVSLRHIVLFQFHKGAIRTGDGAERIQVP